MILATRKEKRYESSQTVSIWEIKVVVSRVRSQTSSKRCAQNNLIVLFHNFHFKETECKEKYNVILIMHKTTALRHFTALSQTTQSCHARRTSQRSSKKIRNGFKISTNLWFCFQLQWLFGPGKEKLIQYIWLCGKKFTQMKSMFQHVLAKINK